MIFTLFVSNVYDFYTLVLNKSTRKSFRSKLEHSLSKVVHKYNYRIIIMKFLDDEKYIKYT